MKKLLSSLSLPAILLCLCSCASDTSDSPANAGDVHRQQVYPETDSYYHQEIVRHLYNDWWQATTAGDTDKIKQAEAQLEDVQHRWSHLYGTVWNTDEYFPLFNDEAFKQAWINRFLTDWSRVEMKELEPMQMQLPSPASAGGSWYILLYESSVTSYNNNTIRPYDSCDLELLVTVDAAESTPSRVVFDVDRMIFRSGSYDKVTLSARRLTVTLHPEFSVSFEATGDIESRWEDLITDAMAAWADSGTMLRESTELGGKFPVEVRVDDATRYFKEMSRFVKRSRSEAPKSLDTKLRAHVRSGCRSHKTKSYGTFDTLLHYAVESVASDAGGAERAGRASKPVPYYHTDTWDFYFFARGEVESARNELCAEILDLYCFPRGGRYESDSAVYSRRIEVMKCK